MPPREVWLVDQSDERRCNALLHIETVFFNPISYKLRGAGPTSRASHRVSTLSISCGIFPEMTVFGRKRSPDFD